jgi:hypothetical protein
MSYYNDLYFVLAGKLSEDARDIAETVHSIGAHVVKNVNKKVTALVLGRGNVRSGTKLLDAKRLGIAVIDERQMWSMLGMRMISRRSPRKSPTTITTTKTRRSPSLSSHRSAHRSATRTKSPKSARKSSKHSRATMIGSAK